MSEYFLDWKYAHSAAVKLARDLGREVGLAKTKVYGKSQFVVFHLPRPENRYGFELRCEVVGPND